MPSRAGRKAYPSRPLDSYLTEADLVGELVECTRSATIDGHRLTAVEETHRTPDPLDVRPEAKYEEGFTAAVAACAMGLREVAVSTRFPDGSLREAPDVLLRAKDHPPIDVEVVMVDETRPVYVRLLRVEAILREFVYAGRRADRPFGITVAYEKVKAFGPTEFDALAAELIDFWRGEPWRHLTPGQHQSVFADGSAAARAGAVVETGRRTYASLLTFAQVNGKRPLDLILRTIDAKKKLSYRHQHELWLVVHVGDPRGPFREALEEVLDSVTDLTPFSRIIVGDGHFFVTLPILESGSDHGAAVAKSAIALDVKNVTASPLRCARTATSDFIS